MSRSPKKGEIAVFCHVDDDLNIRDHWWFETTAEQRRDTRLSLKSGEQVGIDWIAMCPTCCPTGHPPDVFQLKAEMRVVRLPGDVTWTFGPN